MAVKTYGGSDIDFGDSDFNFAGGSMADRYWVGDTDGTWNDADNWSTTSGGAGGAGVPTSSDDVIFDDQYTTQNCTCDVAIDVNSIDVQSTYDGILDLANSAYAHAVAGDTTLDGSGGFDMGDSTLTVGGNFDNDDQSGWTRGSSTLVMTGTGKTLTSNGSNDLQSLTINSGATITMTTQVDYRGVCSISGTLTATAPSGSLRSVDGDLQIESGGTLTGTGNTVIQNNAECTKQDGTISIAYMEMQGGHEAAGSYLVPATYDVALFGLKGFGAGDRGVIFSAGSYTFTGNFTISNSGSALWFLDVATNDSTINIDGNFNVSNTGLGTIEVYMGDDTWTVDGDWNTSQAEDVTGNSSTLIMTGTSKTITTSALQPFNDLTIAAGATITTGNANLLVDGDLTVGGTFTPAYDFKMNSITSELIVSGSGVLDCATHDPDVIALNDVTLGGSTVSMGSGTWTVSGSWDSTTVTTINHNNGNLDMAGTSKTIDTNGDDFYDLTISGTISADTNVDYINDMVVSGTLTLNGAAIRLRMTAGSATMTVQAGANITGTGYIVTNANSTTISPVGTGQISCDHVDVYGDCALSPSNNYNTDINFLGALATPTTNTIASGTYTFNGNVLIDADAAGNFTLDASTNDPTINVTGNVVMQESGAGALTVSMGDGTWTVGGDFNVSAASTFNRGGSTLVMSGAIKTLTSSSHSFANITITGTVATSGIVNVYGTLDAQGTLTLGALLRLQAGADLVLPGGGTVDGSSELRFENESDFTTFGGTLSPSIVQFSGGRTGDILAGTYDCHVQSTYFTTATVSETWGAGTFTITGNFTFQITSTGTKTDDFATNNPNITVQGNMVTVDGTGTSIVNAGSGLWTVEGNVDISNVDTWSGANANFTLSGAGAGTQTIDFDGQVMDALVINDSGATKQFSAAGFTSNSFTLTDGAVDCATNDCDVYISSTCTLTSGDLSMGDGTWTISSDFDNTTLTTWTRNNSTVVLDGTGKTLTSNNSRDFANLTIDTGATITQSGRVDCQGVLSVSGTLTTNTPDVVALGAGGDLQVESSGLITGTGTIRNTHDSAITVKDGVTDTAVHQIQGDKNTVAGDVFVAATYESALVEFDPNTSSRTLNFAAGTYTFTGDVIIDEDGAGTYTVGCAANPNFVFGGDVTFSESGGGTLTYTAGTGSMTFNSAGTQDVDFLSKTVESIIDNNTAGILSFNETFTTPDFTAIQAGSQIRVTNGKTINVTNSIKIYGTSISEIDIYSDAGGSSFDLNVAGAASEEVGYCSFKDCNNTGDSITVAFGTDVSGNSGLIFVDAFVWTGNGGDALASTGSNWVGDIGPTAGLPIRFEDNAVDCTFDLSTTFTNLDIISDYSGTITITDAADFSTNVTQAGGTIAFTAGNSLNVDGSVNLTGGAFDLTDGTLRVGGDLTVGVGSTFTPSTSVVVLNGAGAQDITVNGNNFGGVTVSNSGGDVTFVDSLTLTGTFTDATAGSSLLFGDGETFVFPTLTLTGTSGNEITLRSTADGSPWNLNVTTPTVSFVDVKDSDASGGNTITQLNSIDSGGNTNWDFGAAPPSTIIEGVNMDSITISITATAQSLGDLLRDFLHSDNQTKIDNGDPVRLDLLFQAPVGNGANVFFGSSERQTAFVAAGATVSLITKVNIQETFVKGTGGDSLIVVIVD